MSLIVMTAMTVGFPKMGDIKYSIISIAGESVPVSYQHCPTSANLVPL